MIRAARRLRVAAALAALAAPAAADSTSGVDGALFRSSYDSNGIFALEGARLMPVHDLSFKVLVGYARSPIDVAVPGIGAAAGDLSGDRILEDVATLDLAFGMTLSERLAFGLDIAAYRARTGPGYGARGRFLGGGAVDPTRPSTGLVALRPLTNIDPSADPDDASAFLGDELAGPLDARIGLKLAVIRGGKLSVTAIGSLFLPFGEDEMLLGDRNLVFEPKLALDWHRDRISATRVVANLALRIRQRAVLEGYDTLMPGASETDARAFLDVGSEAVAGIGGVYELTPRAALAGELQLFIPLPETVGWGRCLRHNGDPCETLGDADYFGDAGRGDFTALVTLGATLRLSADLGASVMVGTGQLGARGDDVRVTTGVTWAPQPEGASAPGRNDRDRDGIPDGVDGCSEDGEDKDGFQDEDGCPDPDNDGDGLADADDSCADEPEDKDGFQDGDGCPERDNDRDAVADAADRCPDQGEDVDGFEDEDGCPDDDNDGDGFADGKDRCPNDAETVNGFEDDDGCPDVRGTTGPEERADRIDLKAGQVTFARNTATLTAAARALLAQVAAIVKARRLSIRVEVHVALGTRAAAPAVVAAQRRRDKLLANQRARAILEYLIGQGVTVQQLQAVGIGSDRPLGTTNPTDPSNERVDFIKAQQAGSP